MKVFNRGRCADLLRRAGGLAMIGLASSASARYCAATSGYTPCSSAFEYISNVTVESIHNDSPCSTGAYEDYTATTTNMSIGTSYPISVTLGAPFQGDHVRVFIDWNHNNVLTDAGEEYILGESTYPVYTGSIQPPNNALLGPTRMRVRMTFSSTPVPCGNSGTYGNIEDYTVNVTPPGGPTLPNGSASANPTDLTTCGTGGVTLLSVIVSGGLNPPSTGLTVRGNLTSIGGSESQAFYDDGSHGDATAGDNRFCFQATVPSSIGVGSRAIPITITDDQSRSNVASTTVNLSACPTSGPDVYVGTVVDVAIWGTVDVDPSAATLNVTAYSVGTDACNLGDVPVYWIDNNSHPGHNTNEHPVIAQNMFRLKGGRYEQIGQSWLKHGFVSTNSDGCASCVSPPFGGDQLGVNCSDTYGAGLNGGQGNMGPRYQVNATTGAYPFPPASPAFDPTIGKRLQVYTNDVNPATNTGAVYFVDTHYVTADDARWTSGASPASNGLNNASYRKISIVNTTATPTFLANTVRFKTGLDAWKAEDPTVQMANADYLDQSIAAAGITARFQTACKVTNNGNGTWHYEYAVYNLNADRCGGSFSVPIDSSAVVTNVGFHGVFEHSGAPYPNTALNPDNWVGGKVGGQVVWNCPEAYNAAVGGDNGNALRWGTMYNFRFDTNVAPSAGGVTVGLYKPATATNTATSASATLSVPVTPCGTADFDGDGDTGTDADIEAFFACLGGTCCPTCFPGGSDFNMDGDSGTDADIESFFSVLGGNGC